MNIEQEKDIWRREVSKGERAKKTYDFFLKPFFKEKRQNFFETFCAASIKDEDGIMEIKRQLKVLDAMELEITQMIETGKLAAKSLETAAQQEKEND